MPDQLCAGAAAVVRMAVNIDDGFGGQPGREGAA